MTSRHDDRMAVRGKVLAALIEASAHREAGWEEYEREAMTVAANRWAVSHGYPTITVDQVEAIEHRAVGHSDYGSKIALYIAELVVPHIEVTS